MILVMRILLQKEILLLQVIMMLIKEMKILYSKTMDHLPTVFPKLMVQCRRFRCCNVDV